MGEEFIFNWEWGGGGIDDDIIGGGDVIKDGGEDDKEGGEDDNDADEEEGMNGFGVGEVEREILTLLRSIVSSPSLSLSLPLPLPLQEEDVESFFIPMLSGLGILSGWIVFSSSNLLSSLLRPDRVCFARNKS